MKDNKAKDNKAKDNKAKDNKAKDFRMIAPDVTIKQIRDYYLDIIRAKRDMYLNQANNDRAEANSDSYSWADLSDKYALVAGQAMSILKNAWKDNPSICSNCGREGAAPHTCPYKSEINRDDESLCTCCESCERECALEI